MPTLSNGYHIIKHKFRNLAPRRDPKARARFVRTVIERYLPLVHTVGKGGPVDWAAGNEYWYSGVASVNYVFLSVISTVVTV